MKRAAFVATALSGALACGRASADEAAPDVARARFEIGPAYARLYDIPVYGGEGFVGVGLDHPDWAWSVGMGAFFGRTQYGLSVGEARLAFMLEGRIDPLRIGAELRLEWLTISRATPHDAFASLGSGIRPYTAIDLVRWRDDRALTLSLGVDMDVYADVVWGPSLRVGARF